MDDRRFDSLTKALAEGKSRRSVLKGLLGLGGAALAGSVVLDGDSEAARRPPATRTPIPRCPGGQTWNPTTSKCDCPTGKSQCAPNGGPACCNDQVPVGPGYSECCDNACCHYPNDCVGEEMCCPRLPEVGCLNSRGRCCTTVCEETPLGAECCSADEFCPGGSTSADLCCHDGATCCGRGTNANACVDLSIEGNCCTEADCEDPCLVCNPRTHICEERCDEGEVCCTLQAGPGRCQEGTCCPGAPCSTAGQLCCVYEDVATCVTTGECCTVDADCDNGCLSCIRGACIAQCGRDTCCTAAPDRADWFCRQEGQCCTSENCDDPPDLCSEGVCDDDHHCTYTGCGTDQKCCGPTSDLCVPKDAQCCTPPMAFSGIAALQELPLLCPQCKVCNGEGYCVPNPLADGNFCGGLGDDDDSADDGLCCDGVCVLDAECCNDDQCEDPDEICCVDAHACGPSCSGGVCCPGGFCDGPSGACCPPPNVGCNGGVCCNGECDGKGDCCPDGNFHCTGGVCCPEQCAGDKGYCPVCSGDSCAVDQVCCGDDGCQSNAEYLTCKGGCCPIDQACCDIDGCCSGVCYGGANDHDYCCPTGSGGLFCKDGEPGDQCCDDPDIEKCCGTAGCCAGQCTGEGGNQCCTTGLQCQPEDDPLECCPNSADYKCCGGNGCCLSTNCTTDLDCCDADSFACGAECCLDAQHCCSDGCCDSECGTDRKCPPPCEDQCQYRCDVIETGCDCGDCPLTPSGGPQFCTSAGWCCPGTSLGTDDNCRWCGDACLGGTTCQTDDNGRYVCAAPPCDAFCCSLQDCIDVSAGDDECMQCSGGDCIAANPYAVCNNGAGYCDSTWCYDCLGEGDGTCNVDNMCCGDLWCSSAGVCVTCRPDGDACMDASECCAGRICSGTCMVQ